MDTDSTQIIVKFDNEKNLKGFTSSIYTATRMPTQSQVALILANEETSRKLNTEKSIVGKIFANKYHNSETPFFVTGDILLLPKKGIPVEVILDKFRIDGQLTKKWLSGSVVICLNNWDAIFDIANAIHESGMVEWCHPDFATIIERTTNDPMFNQQYYLKNNGQNGGTSGIDIKAEPAWAITTGSNNIRVAVIDDGVENHEDLNGRVLQGFTPLNLTGFGAPTTQNVPDVTIGHGQACAGIIAASHNTMGIAGVAPNVRIVPINIFHTWVFDPSQNRWVNIETVQNIADAIEFAWDPARGNADVISNSWGYRTTNNVAPAIVTAINGALTQGRTNNLGSIVVFASGNWHQSFSGVSFPANVNGVIAVGAVNRSGTVWNYSSRGNELAVVAPSGNTDLLGDVATTDRMGANGYENGNYTSRFGGTSAAAPQVAGVAALILSIRPDLSAQQVRNAIELNCNKNLPHWTVSQTLANGTWNTELGYGLVNANAALYSVVRRIEGPVSCFVGQTVSYTAYNLPAGFSWTCSSNLTPGSASGDTKSFTAISPGYAWVKATSGSIQIMYDIYIYSDAPNIAYISGPDNVFYNPNGSSSPSTDEEYTVVLANNNAPPYNYVWGMDGNSSYYSLSQNGNTVTVSFKIDFSWSFKLNVGVSNSYGWDYMSKYITFNGAQKSGSSPKFYPNPVSDILYVEIDQETVDRVKALQQNSGKNLNADPVFDIRFFNGYGLQLRQQSTKGGTVQLNVSDLPNGLYFLYINDGVSGKPERVPVIVKHL